MDQIKPKIINLSSNLDLEHQLSSASLRKLEYVDIFKEQAHELLESIYFSSSKILKEKENQYLESEFGNIVIYPWSNTAIRILKESDFLRLLTSRNKNLINKNEQVKYYNATLAVAGLSVGSNIVLSVVMQGGCKNIRIADNDELSTSNLNRIIGSLLFVGQKKTEVLAKKLYEINPYIKVECYSEGITETNLTEFLTGADVVFDEIDSLGLKVDIRLLAKQKSIPLVMITDNGDNVMVDVERYDKDANLQLFHGLLSKDDIVEIKKSHGGLPPKEKVRLSLKIVQPENAVPRMQQSLMEVGKSLKTWPQLSTASWLAGTVGSYIIRRILNDLPICAGRSHVSIDAVLVPDYNSKKSVESRLKQTNELLKTIS